MESATDIASRVVRTGNASDDARAGAVTARGHLADAGTAF
jgi:hypothetical protein